MEKSVCWSWVVYPGPYCFFLQSALCLWPQTPADLLDSSLATASCWVPNLGHTSKRLEGGSKGVAWHFPLTVLGNGAGSRSNSDDSTFQQAGKHDPLSSYPAALAHDLTLDPSHSFLFTIFGLEISALPLAV